MKSITGATSIPLYGRDTDRRATRFRQALDVEMGDLVTNNIFYNKTTNNTVVTAGNSATVATLDLVPFPVPGTRLWYQSSLNVNNTTATANYGSTLELYVDGVLMDSSPPLQLSADEHAIIWDFGAVDIRFGGTHTITAVFLNASNPAVSLTALDAKLLCRPGRVSPQ